MTALRLADRLRQQSDLLAELLGSAYSIEDSGPASCTVHNSHVEIQLGYDQRDQWLTAMLRPLNVPPELSESYPDHSWLRSCEIEVDPPQKGPLDDQQVIDSLSVLRPIIDLLKDKHSARDAACFVRGYSTAYTDWASGKFG